MENFSQCRSKFKSLIWKSHVARTKVGRNALKILTRKPKRDLQEGLGVCGKTILEFIIKK
jgi:hypothetical protein